MTGLPTVLDSLGSRLSRRSETTPAGHSDSSVLVLVALPSATLILTKRSHHVETHKGQVSFPGGFYEPHDGDLRQTALRESQEELGIDPNHVTILGPLDRVSTKGGVSIQPWVATLAEPYPFVPNEEVDRLLFLPLADLMARELDTHLVEGDGYRIQSPGIFVDGELVWGATARILQHLRDEILTKP